VEGCTLYVEDVDIVNRTPLLDIKPYIPEFDIREVERVGWYAKRVKRVAETEADDRFK
jgi:tRNA (Thr-GGU) A37 N-methylase